MQGVGVRLAVTEVAYWLPTNHLLSRWELHPLHLTTTNSTERDKGAWEMSEKGV